MQKTNVCIISKNKELARFFELELIGLGYEVVVSATTEVHKNSDIAIIDRDSVKEAVRCTCPALNISKVQNEEQSGFLPWPTPINAIKERLLQLIEASAVTYDAQKLTEQNETVLKIGERTFLINGVAVELSKHQTKLLLMLCRAEGEIVSREKIMAELGAVDGNISDVYVCHLRKKLEGQFGRRLIFTHRNKGYSTSLILRE